MDYSNYNTAKVKDKHRLFYLKGDIEDYASGNLYLDYPLPLVPISDSSVVKTTIKTKTRHYSKKHKKHVHIR